jgi:inner membrane protein
MDYITHIVTGATGYRIIRTQSLLWTDDWKEQALITCGGLFFLASVLPDFDNISRLWGMEAYIIHHRGMTHSIPFTLIIACMFGFLFGKYLKWASSLRIFFSVLTGMAFHLYMDLITSYGTQLFWPFTNERLRLDWVFIVDPIYTVGIILILLGTFTLAKKPAFEAFSEPFTDQHYAKSKWKNVYFKRLLVASFILWVVGYPLICALTKEFTEGWIARSKNLTSQWAIMPELGTPFIWKLINLEDNTYRVASVNIVSESIKFYDGTFNPLDKTLAAKVSEDLPSFRTYMWFALYPYQRVLERSNGQKMLEVGDLRFFSPLWIIQKRRATPPFTIFIHFSTSGIPINLTYGSP